MSGRRLSVGADIGGTFTDLVVIDQDSGEITNCKTLTTADDPAKGVLRGLQEALSLVDARPEDVQRFVHATTLPTNLVLERKGARVACLLTEGFGDMFAISRQYPSGADRFDMGWQRPPSIVDHELTVEVRERIKAGGKVALPVDLADLDAKLERLAVRAPEAFAICLLHAYINNAHERLVADRVRARFPDATISLSSDVWPEFREYERASATVLSAYVGPTFNSYIDRLRQSLTEIGVPAQLKIMQSNGAIMGVSEAIDRAAYTIESGPAAGVIAAAYSGRMSGRQDIISFDMGGTTAKAGLVTGGQPRIAQEVRVGGKASSSGQREAGEPIRIPVIDLAEVGAGGGSIAWVDDFGHLRLGPHSASSHPGPACYAKGGTEPTTTDANLVLGYLDARYFNGGKMNIDPLLAHKAIEEKVARPLGLSVVEAARGIHSIANAHMGAAIRMVTLQRGIDPRDHPIVAFGGAGPLHIVHLAQMFNITEVIVPISPGVKSAFGLMISDTAYDMVRTYITSMADADVDNLLERFAELTEEAEQMIVGERNRGAETAIMRALDIAYAHKFQTTTVAMPDGPIDAGMLKQVEADFRAEQFQLFGVDSSDSCRIMGIRVRASAKTVPPPKPTVDASATTNPQAAIKYRRSAWFLDAGGFVETPVYDRAKLAPGTAFAGPAIIEEPDSTTVCPPGCSVSVDDMLSLLIAVGKSEDMAITAKEQSYEPT